MMGSKKMYVIEHKLLRWRFISITGLISPKTIHYSKHYRIKNYDFFNKNIHISATVTSVIILAKMVVTFSIHRAHKILQEERPTGLRAVVSRELSLPPATPG